MDDFGLRVWKEIDLNAIRNNLLLMHSFFPDKKILSVVKADAYGHGAVEVSQKLQSDTDYFAVATPEEAIELRKNQIKKPIMILGFSDPADYFKLITNDIELTIFRLSDAEELNKEAALINKKAKIHIAIDTGMSRIGFDLSDNTINKILQISNLSNIEIVGIFTHFSDADGSSLEYTNIQIKKFNSVYNRLLDKGLSIPIRHIYNSAASSRFSDCYEMYREGICLYGVKPSIYLDNNVLNKLQRTMQVRSKLIFIKTVPSNTDISYGRTYRTKKETIIGTVSAGYADGISRKLSNNFHVLVNGVKCNIIGRICMDMFMIDLSDVKNPHVGNLVTIIGQDGNSEISVSDMSSVLGTIEYEVFCGFSKRVKRIYN